MGSKRLIFLATVNLIFIINTSSGSNCNRNDLPEVACEINNGYQLICECLPFGGGCWCSCPPETEMIDGTCHTKPNRIGERCISFNSCSKIPGAICNATSSTCQCTPNTYPANNLASCIPSPNILGDKCSEFAPCETTIIGSECQQISDNYFQCECVADSLPNRNSTACYHIPTKIGDNCSQFNPCSSIPSAVCVENVENIEPTCECPNHYVHGENMERCLPSKIGLKCSDRSPCEKIERASCFGAPEVAICLCLWNIPNLSLTECLPFE